MKKIFNTIMLISLAVFSFYYTEKVALMMQEKDEIMLQILQNKDKYTVKSVNALIDGDTIIPGVEGKTVNKASSYKKMKEANYYNESLFLYDYIKPDVSIVYNLDKVIIKGNYIAEMRNCQAFTLSLLCVTIFLTRSISKGDM